MITFVIYACGDDTTTNTNTGTSYDAYSINGTITFADTLFGPITNGSYIVAAFTSWPPPPAPPAAYDSCRITKVGNVYTATFKMYAPTDGKYFISSGWRRLTGGASPVMGIYGCDTMHFIPPSQTCPVDTAQMLKAIITGGKGIGNVNFLSWADTTKKIF